MSENSERQLIKIVRELCAEKNLTLRTYSGDWILEVEGADRRIVVGYKFPNNSASASELCDDKSALYAVLEHGGIPAVPHWFFMSPDESHFIGATGNWSDLSDLLKKYGKLVLKPNAWSGGEDVTIVRDSVGLERETQRLFQKYRSIAASPYLAIADEFRAVILNGAAELVYRKRRASVSGDGKSPVFALIFEKFGKNPPRADAEFDPFGIPAAGERVVLQWKHNLGQGADAEIVPSGALRSDLIRLAADAAQIAGVAFASVDLVSVGGSLSVLEINSGVKLENFARKSEENYAIAKRIYRKALESINISANRTPAASAEAQTYRTPAASAEAQKSDR